MNAFFWVATVVMAVVACVFVASPLLKKRRWRPVVIVAIALPVLSIGLYAYLGSPSSHHAGQARAISSSSQQSTVNAGAGSVASLIEGLSQRLEDNPDDGKGWLLLAKSYNHLNRPSEAIAAYEKASALGQGDGELEALLQPFSFDTEASAQVYGNVSLTFDAQDVVLPDDTVFVFARAVGGPQMPAAVMRFPASELPFDFMLNNSQSITEDVKLSMFDRVIVTARISRSGIATETLRGLEAKSADIAVNDGRFLNLVITNKE